MLFIKLKNIFLTSFSCRLAGGGNSKDLPEEERRIREQEAALFSKMAEPPKVTDSVDYLLQLKNADATKEEVTNGRAARTSKRKRV